MFMIITAYKFNLIHTAQGFFISSTLIFSKCFSLSWYRFTSCSNLLFCCCSFSKCSFFSDKEALNHRNNRNRMCTWLWTTSDTTDIGKSSYFHVFSLLSKCNEVLMILPHVWWTNLKWCWQDMLISFNISTCLNGSPLLLMSKIHQIFPIV